MQLSFQKLGTTFALDSIVDGTVVTEDVLNGAVKVLALHLGVVESSIEYLLQYGLSQSLQDCVAGRAKAVGDEYKAQCAKDGKAPDDAELVALTTADLVGTMNKRLDAIKAGTVGARTTRDQLYSIALEYVKAAAKRQNIAMKTEQAEDLANKFLAVPEKRAIAQAEYDRRKAFVEVEIEI